MEKIKSLLTSKKFWTLVAAVVTALTVFFTTGCATQIELRRKGLHCDSVEYHQIIKSNNFNKSVLWSQMLNSSPRFLTGDWLSPGKFSNVSLPLSMRHTFSLFERLKEKSFSCLSSMECCLVLPLTTSISSLDSVLSSIRSRISSVVVRKFAYPMSGVSAFSLAFLPLSLAVPFRKSFGTRARKGGRRGKPSGSKIKNIPLGGRHL